MEMRRYGIWLVKPGFRARAAKVTGGIGSAQTIGGYCSELFLVWERGILQLVRRFNHFLQSHRHGFVVVQLKPQPLARCQ